MLHPAIQRTPSSSVPDAQTRASADQWLGSLVRTYDVLGKDASNSAPYADSVFRALWLAPAAKRQAWLHRLIQSSFIESPHAHRILFINERLLRSPGLLVEWIDALLEQNRRCAMIAIWLTIRTTDDSLQDLLAKRVTAALALEPFPAGLEIRHGAWGHGKRSDFRSLASGAARTTLLEAILMNQCGGRYRCLNSARLTENVPLLWLRGPGGAEIAVDLFTVLRRAGNTEFDSFLDFSSPAIKRAAGESVDAAILEACGDPLRGNDLAHVLEAIHCGATPVPIRTDAGIESSSGWCTWATTPVEIPPSFGQGPIGRTITITTLAMAMFLRESFAYAEVAIEIACGRAGLDAHFGIVEGWDPVFHCIATGDDALLAKLVNHGLRASKTLCLLPPITHSDGAGAPLQGEPELDASGQRTGRWHQTPMQYAINHGKTGAIGILGSYESRLHLRQVAARRLGGADPVPGARLG
jgi:hypothetical protein